MLQSIRLWEREKFKDDDTLQRKRTGAYLSLYFIQGFSHGLQRDAKRGFLIFVNLTCQILRQEGNIHIEEKSHGDILSAATQLVLV